MHVINKIICKRGPLWSLKPRAASAKDHAVCTWLIPACPQWTPQQWGTGQDLTIWACFEKEMSTCNSPFSILEWDSAKFLEHSGIHSCVRLLQAVYSSLTLVLSIFFFISVILHEEKVNEILHLHTAYLLGTSLFDALHFWKTHQSLCISRQQALYLNILKLLRFAPCKSSHVSFCFIWWGHKEAEKHASNSQYQCIMLKDNNRRPLMRQEENKPYASHSH